MQMWSLNANDSPYVGRAYFKTKTTSIFLLKIVRNAIEDAKYNGYLAADAYSLFLANLAVVEIHELLHLFFKFELGKWAYSENLIMAIDEKMVVALQEEGLCTYTNLFWEVYEWMKRKLDEVNG